MKTFVQGLLATILLFGSISARADIESIITYETGRMEKKIYTKGYGLSIGHSWRFGEKFSLLTRGLVHRHNLNKADVEKIVSDGEDLDPNIKVFDENSVLNKTAFGISQGLGFDIKWGNSTFRPFSEVSYMRGKLYAKIDKTLHYRDEEGKMQKHHVHGEMERMYHKVGYGFGIQWIYKNITINLRHQFSKVMYDKNIKAYINENGTHEDESGPADENITGKAVGDDDFMNTFSVGLGFVF